MPHPCVPYRDTLYVPDVRGEVAEWSKAAVLKFVETDTIRCSASSLA